MKLRRQPKHKQCYEAGPVRNAGKNTTSLLKELSRYKVLKNMLLSMQI